MKSKWLKVLLPVLVVAVGALGARVLILAKPEPQPREPEVPVPLVRVAEVRHQEVTLSVASQGTVTPRTESVLVSEVAGRVIEVAPAFVSGGFFEENEVLLRIDPRDYRQALIQARANVASAEVRLELERAEAEVARKEWGELGDGDASPLTLREPQVREAEAALEAARAAVVTAERNLDRTEIRAAFAGRVRTKQADVGQYVTPGTPLGTVYAVDYVEIRLPLPDRDLAFLDLPLVYRGEAARNGPEVLLRAEFAGKTYEWRGRIVRTEGEIDPRSRMVHAVARVKDPYARGADPGRPPLAVGIYVEAEIIGRTLEDVAVIPRAALRTDGRVLVVDAEERLGFREVEILRSTQESVVVGAGLAEGERVCISALSAVTEGMRVRVLDGSTGSDDAGNDEVS